MTNLFGVVKNLFDGLEYQSHPDNRIVLQCPGVMVVSMDYTTEAVVGVKVTVILLDPKESRSTLDGIVVAVYLNGRLVDQTFFHDCELHLNGLTPYGEHMLKVFSRDTKIMDIPCNLNPDELLT